MHAARAAEAIHQSDDAVRRNLPPDLVPVFDAIKGRIKGSPKRSRTETFLQWVEENPGEVVAMQDKRAERELRALLRAQGVRPRKAAPRSKTPPPTTSWDDVWDAADAAVYLD